ncbi:MAG TPA: response regulator [Candidatus Acidoferrales bacterium]|jgi:CheY-like chemotaxis protein|nr:response regulator [Candidatus Acidoferrales bacterium]
MGKVLLFVDDLFFRAKIAETARHMGVELEAANSVDSLVEMALTSPNESGSAGTRTALILVDLNARGNPVDALDRLKTAGNQTPVIAFLSHVQTELAERARAAGCSEIMPRSKFTQELAAILGRVKT